MANTDQPPAVLYCRVVLYTLSEISFCLYFCMILVDWLYIMCLSGFKGIMQRPVPHIISREMCPCLLLFKSLTAMDAVASVAATYFTCSQSIDVLSCVISSFSFFFWIRCWCNPVCLSYSRLKQMTQNMWWWQDFNHYSGTTLKFMSNLVFLFSLLNSSRLQC